MQRYGTIFMLFEITTIFLNAHWFMDKLGISGTLIQIINDITLVLSYLGIRIMFGTYAIYNCLVSSLNYYWFYKLVRATIRQFTSRSDGVRLKKTR
ncbi:hypothetical protein EV182_003621 [Spiromyces aspiralis]|uniref:Uncharacterized protein n=1 Tax=Spiromyces aspiralis TaxID=68401 RepID=A0ACC1HQ25_9FUNG|nr:hypothetical protein EV182_003621 [Spiromyces aspiralis]